jgi:hypothetical protein
MLISPQFRKGIYLLNIIIQNILEPQNTNVSNKGIKTK